MTEQPTSLSSSLLDLRSALDAAHVAVIDFETTGVKSYDQIVGMGVYLPETGRAFYINVGHMVVDPKFPRCSTAQLTEATSGFLADQSRHLIAHNATFELRFLLRLGLTIRCRTSCTLVHNHRADENLRGQGTDRVTHYHVRNVSYGLKELTTIFFDESPPTIMEATSGRNAMFAEPRAVGVYCVLDCYNTWRLYKHARPILDALPNLRDLTDQIDDPNMLVLSKMMLRGILIDTEAASSQADLYTSAIQNCRQEIWRLARISLPIDTPDEIRTFLRKVGYKEEGYDPFYYPLYDWERDPSVSREVLLDVFDNSEGNKQQIIALFIAKTMMEQRLAAFLVPLPKRVDVYTDRLYADNFSSTLVTTRFSTSPNLQNMPRTMGDGADVDEDELWIRAIPEDCRPIQATKDIFIAKPGHTLVAMDLSAAEPRYLSLLFQRALKEQDANLRLKVRDLRELRKARYPTLLRLMRESAEPFRERPHDDFLWPEYEVDPLYRVFKDGVPVNDPYNALLIAMDPEGHEHAKAAEQEADWFAAERWRGKRAFLALGYGSTARNLYKPLQWSLQRTEQAIASIEHSYATLNPLRELTLREVIQTGEVRSLWGRPRRLNGYYQLARPFPVTVGFYRMRPSFRRYEADIIPLGTTQQAVQAFVSECRIMSDDGREAEVVFAADPETGAIEYQSMWDPFITAEHFNNLPFRNVNYSQINWVRDQDGLVRKVSKQARVQRQALNAMCQSTGADHLRWLMNRMDEAVESNPQFAACDLILTVHDSLIYEVPDDLVDAFVAMARPIMETPPTWCDISIKVGIEAGKRYGEMRKI